MATIDIKRLSATVITVKIDDSSKLRRVLNGEDTIILSFNHDSFTEVRPGDYITWEGITYTVKQAPEFRKISARSYHYEIKFEGPYKALDEAMFLLDSEGEFDMTGKAEDFIDLMVTNLNRVHGGGAYSKGSVDATDFKNLTFTNETSLNVLQRLCTEFELEYSFSAGIEINLVDRVGNSSGLNLEYHDGLRNIRRSKVSEKDIVTRLYAYGAEKNISNSYGAKRLHLPVGTYPNRYIEDGTANYGIREAVKFFDDIYPHFEGAVTSSSANNKVIDTAINFNLNDYLIEGLTAKIVFRTGDLAGYEFEISSFNNSTKEVTFNTYTDETGLEMPSDDFNPGVGDEFTFVDISMPSTYIENSEVDLAIKALQYLAQMSSPNVKYEVDVDWHNLQSRGVSLDVGDLVMITDEELASGGLEFRILELSQSLANPYKYSITIGEHILVGYLSRVSTEREKLKREVVIQKRDLTKAIRRKYVAVDELQDLIFDTDGYFDPEKIKPLSIETSMLTVGNKSTQLALVGILAQPNYQGNGNYLKLSTGSLIHFTIEATAQTWTISVEYTTTVLASASAYYIYVRCSKVTSTATWLVVTAQYSVDPDDGFYYFLVGILSSVIDDTRRISWLYGQTTMNGGFIRTGRIESLDGETYIDLDSGDAVLARASFKSSDVGKRVEITNDALKFYDSAGVQTFILDEDAWAGNPGMAFANGSIFIMAGPTTSQYTIIKGGLLKIRGLSNLDGGYYLTYNPSTGDFTYYGSTSDIRLKKNVKVIADALEKIIQLKGFTFNLNKKGQEVTGQDGRPQAGLSAQDVNRILPEAVTELGESGYLKLDYDAIIALLVEAVKEHREETKAIESEVLGLKTEIKKLRDLIQDLFEKE